MSSIHAILILIIRLWAAYVVLTFLGSFFQLLGLVMGVIDNADALALIFYLQPLFWIVAGVTAWIAAPKIAQKLFKAGDTENVSIDMDAELLVKIGSFLIGAFILVEHGPQLLIKSATFFIESVWPGQETPISILKFLFRQVATETLIVIFALWLVLRPAHLSAIFSKLRYAGLSSQQKSDSKGESQ